tara:strand:- start:125 stop:907 length:783 start_codon:yes stop_codon:yes gene_type:complete
MQRIIALIPARSGSKRIVNKNIKPLVGHPLVAYTIAAALKSEIFSDVIVSTDSEQYADIAKYYGALVPFLRPERIATDISPDIEWVTHTLQSLSEIGNVYDCFSILRPTSPFRHPETIRRAWRMFKEEEYADSLRAIEKCSQHPAKMWFVEGKGMKPVLEGQNDQVPWHSSQYQTLPKVYAQNASLEIAWSKVVFDQQSISGDTIVPFITHGFEGFDINQDYDWDLAHKMIENGRALLPVVENEPYLNERFDLSQEKESA